MGTYIVVGYLLDFLLGGLTRLPHPVSLIGKLIISMEKIIRRFILGSIGTRTAGILLALITVVLTYLMTWFVIRIAWVISPWLYAIVCSIFIFYSLAVRSFSVKAMKVYKALQEGDCTLAIERLSNIVSTDTYDLKEEGIIRGTVETLAENTVEGIIAPLFYIFLGGPALAMAYKAVKTLFSMVGYRNEEYKEFGWASVKMYEIVNWVPARITGFIIPFAAGVWGKIYSRDKNKHKSPNSGHPIAAMAGVLGVRLGGSSEYFGKIVEKPFFGDPKKPLEMEDILDASRIMNTTAFLGLVVFYLIAMKFGFR
jgi:adenosylcobinamide-phosphate synthase